MQMTKKTIPTAAAIVNCQLEAWTLQIAQIAVTGAAKTIRITKRFAI